MLLTLRYLMLCLLPLTLLVNAPASADVFTYTDADGNRVYTDHPPTNGHAKRVEITPTNELSNTPQTRKLSPPKPQPPPMPPMVHYDLLRILVPDPDAVIRSQAGELIVTATSEPELLPGDTFHLLLDGNPSGEPGRSPVFPLTNIDRGAHQLAVEIVDSYGRTVERTASQKFQMLRISLKQRRLADPCAEADWGVRPECPIGEKPKPPTKWLPFL